MIPEQALAATITDRLADREILPAGVTQPFKPMETGACSMPEAADLVVVCPQRRLPHKVSSAG